jgi:hypothetical protein
MASGITTSTKQAFANGSRYCLFLTCCFSRAQLNLIRSEEFRKNAVKFGWELWEEKTAT